MFYIITNNNKKIKIKNLILDGTEVSFEVNMKYIGTFSSQESSLKEIIYKKLFSKPIKINFDSEVAPEYKIVNNKLIISTEIEEL